MAKKRSIEFRKNQFKTLLKAVYIANWIANAQKIEPVKDEYNDLENYIFSFAKKFGFGDFVDHDNQDDEAFYPARAFEEETDVHEKIHEYEADSFWEELIDRMAGLEVSKKFSKEELSALSPEDFFEELARAATKWAEEFEENGITRLTTS